MHYTKAWLSILLVWTVIAVGGSQEYHHIELHSTTLSTQQVKSISQNPERIAWSRYVFEGRLYCLLQFADIPSAEEKQLLERRGVRLLQYLPQYTFLASMPGSISPSQLPVLAAVPLEAAYKLRHTVARRLQYNHTVKVSIVPMPEVALTALWKRLKPIVRHLELNKQGQIIAELNEAAALRVAAQPSVCCLEMAPIAPFPEGEGANAIMHSPAYHRLNDNSVLDGSGITIGIAEASGVSHPDLKNRILQQLDSDIGQAHTAMTTGIAAGAGNIDPIAAGLAAGAQLQLSNIFEYAHIDHAAAFLQQYQTSITSTSYGDACGGIYNTKAAALDAKADTLALVLDCFSAGNRGLFSCSEVYENVQLPQGSAFGNITGGRKTGKSPLTVGNMGINGQLSPESSRGPTEDGRTKPDLCAIGNGSLAPAPSNGYAPGAGTSAAAPAVAGIAALLSQAFKAIYGALPTAALLKNTLLNSATDMGRPGPDFEHGWGLVNGGKALDILEQGQFLTGSSQHQATQYYNINIPAGQAEAKIMLYWQDAAGSPLAAKALVNDLDLQVFGPNGESFRPLVLDPSPEASALLAPAQPGTDRLNNMEQVVIPTPTPGTYTLRVKGWLVPQGPQSYCITYVFQPETPALAFPNQHSLLAPGTSSVISWNAARSNDSFQLAYRKVGASSWLPIAADVPAHRRHWVWAVPEGLTGQYVLRLQQGPHSATSEPFSIMAPPVLRVEAAVDGTSRLAWDSVEGAQEYEVYHLGDRYMEVFGTTTGLSFPLPADAGEGNWYSVQAKGAGGFKSPRAKAQFFRPVDCSLAISLQLQLGSEPQHTSWELFDDQGQLLMSGGPYPLQAQQQTLGISACLPAGCYRFQLKQDGAASDSQYAWYGPDGGLLAGENTVGAMASANFCVQDDGTPPLQVSLQSSPQTSCADTQDGWAVAFPTGGNGSYSFQWSNGENTQQISQLNSGSYTVTISDGLQSVAASTTIASPPPLSVNVVTTDASCLANDGSARAYITGGTPPYAYRWGNGQEEATASGLDAGLHTLTVTDQMGCSHAVSFQINNSSSLQLGLSGDAPSCAASDDGAVFVQISQGVPPYAYQWSNGASTPNLVGVPAGNYQLSLTDATGCGASAAIALEAPPLLTAELAYESASNELTVTADGGLPPYEYLWGDGHGLATRQVSDSSHTVTVTDSQNCLAAASWAAPAPDYCLLEASDNTYNWIQSVQIGDSLHDSGAGAAPAQYYADSLDTELQTGQTYPVTLQPGFANHTFALYWRVWWDQNKDGQFQEPTELIFAADQVDTDSLAFDWAIPGNIPTGSYRLRVAQAFGHAPTACGELIYGETEDYDINVINTIPDTYCESYGISTASEWIDRIVINGQSFHSGNNQGYASFVNTPVSVSQGDSLSLRLVPGFSDNVLPEYWAVWVDLDRNGQFDAEAELLAKPPASPQAVNVRSALPTTASGYFRMRVQMRWNNSFSPCGSYTWGETEDYTLAVMPPQLFAPPPGYPESEEDLQLWPQPARADLQIRLPVEEAGDITIELQDLTGRVIRQQQYLSLPAGEQLLRADLSTLPPGTYILQAHTAAKRYYTKLIKQ